MPSTEHCPKPPTPRWRKAVRAARPHPRLFALVFVGCLLAACTGTPAAPDDAAPSPTAGVRLPEPNSPFDYQLGGPYRPPAGVTTVVRDRTAPAAEGAYNICYVNAFQTQPDGALKRWDRTHPDLLLRDADGDPVIDEDWQEALFDISTPAKRHRLLAVVGPWIDACAEAGYDAVEPDNLDSYTRSGGRLAATDAAAFARLLTARAHARGLAVGQKNTADLLPRRARIGFDFAVVEECARYDECDRFARAYDDRILVVEYRAKDYATACRTAGSTLSVTLRDRALRPSGGPGHVHRHC